MFEQVPEKPVAPLGWRLGPGSFQTAGDRVGTFTCAVTILPAEALLCNRGSLRLGTEIVIGSSTMDFPEGVSPAMSATVS